MRLAIWAFASFSSGSAKPRSAKTLPQLGVTVISAFFAIRRSSSWREQAESESSSHPPLASLCLARLLVKRVENVDDALRIAPRKRRHTCSRRSRRQLTTRYYDQRPAGLDVRRPWIQICAFQIATRPLTRPKKALSVPLALPTHRTGFGTIASADGSVDS